MLADAGKTFIKARYAVLKINEIIGEDV